MRFIPITAAKVEALKKQAKRLQRNGGGKHAVLLDRVARSAGYEHWHHVKLCLNESMGAHNARGLLPEIEAIIDAAIKGVPKMVLTGPEASLSQPFVLMSTADGDAWLLDPERDKSICLSWHAVRQPFVIRDLPTKIEIVWNGTFALSGSFFVVSTENSETRSRHIAGYPVEELRQLLEDVRSADRKIEGIFSPADGVSLSTEIIDQLVHRGWERETLNNAARQGAQYSPSRNSILFPPIGNI